MNVCQQRLQQWIGQKYLFFNEYEMNQVDNFVGACEKWFSTNNIYLESVIDALVKAKLTKDYNIKLEIPISNEEEKLSLMYTKVGKKAKNELVKHNFLFLFELKKNERQSLMLRIGYRVPKVSYLEYNQFEIESTRELFYYMKILAYTLCLNDETKWNSLVDKFNSVGIKL